MQSLLLQRPASYTTLHPRVLYALRDGKSPIWVNNQHRVNKIQCWVADRIPIGVWVNTQAPFNLLAKGVRKISGIEPVRERWKRA